AALDELGPVLAQVRHERLPGTVFQMQHPRPEPGGACPSGGFDHGFDVIWAIGKARQYGWHAHAHVDPCGDQLFDRPQPLLWMGGAALGAPPDVVGDGRGAEGDVEIGAPSKLGKDAESSGSTRAAWDQ